MYIKKGKKMREFKWNIKKNGENSTYPFEKHRFYQISHVHTRQPTKILCKSPTKYCI